MKQIKNILTFSTMLVVVYMTSVILAIQFETAPIYPFMGMLFIHLFTPITKWVADMAKAEGLALELVITDTTYSGTFASYFWLPVTFTMDSIRKGVLYIQDGIKKSHTIGKIDFSSPLQPRAATPTSQGAFTVTGNVLTPQDIMVYTEFNPRDYEAHWLAKNVSWSRYYC